MPSPREITDYMGVDSPRPIIRSTTVISVRRGNSVVLGSDGQVTIGGMIMKSKARKAHRIYKDRVLVGFAGASADALALLVKFEARLEEYNGSLTRAAVELAKDWRLDRALRRLEALLAVCDAKASLIISGTGDIVEPDDGIIAIGSGGPYALAAARAFSQNKEMSALEIVRKSLDIAASICIYTNKIITIEELNSE